MKQTDRQSSLELLAAFQTGHPGRGGERIRFSGVDGKDVYNITAAFADQGEPIIAGRVEGRDTEFSRVVFFHKQEGEAWVPHPRHPAHELQDPFVTRIRDELIFGGVSVIRNPVHPGRIDSWFTQFYRGKHIADLQLFLTGPHHMKDVRLVELQSGEIGVLTRPQGVKGGRGKIGFFKVSSLEELTSAQIEEAPVFEDQFVNEEWGGANEPHILRNGLIGILGHIASFDQDGHRHYYAMTFALHPDTLEKTAMKIIASRDCFPDGPAKRPDLVDVIFSGGLVRHGGGAAHLYVGASDAEAYKIEIRDPFDEYEILA